jgi:hypothetical protein
MLVSFAEQQLSPVFDISVGQWNTFVLLSADLLVKIRGLTAFVARNASDLPTTNLTFWRSVPVF